MKHLLAILLGAAVLAAAPAAVPAREYVQAVEFPYYLYPRTLWERELVWLKSIGMRTVAFSIPWNWHQMQPGDFDFNGRTSPRRDLAGFIRLLRRLDLHAWVRPLPPVLGWLNNGTPAGANAAAQRAWLKQLEQILATQTVPHGGPVAYVEGRGLAIDAAPAPEPVTVISANDFTALARSRQALASGRGALLWTNVEDSLYPAGWAADPSTLLHKGAVGLAGDERPGTAALRRSAALLRNWEPMFSRMQPAAPPKPATGKLAAGVTTYELISPAGAAVCVTNTGPQPFHDDIRVIEPSQKRTMVLPGVTVPPNNSLWLPIGVSLGPEGLCRECTNFSPAEHIAYATAELLAIEFENGILAMEFAAPQPGEVVLQLLRQPVGPYLAAGKPTKFDWDDKALRARLPIPAGQGPGNRVRIGIAMEQPETSGFFNDARRLILGRKNTLSTTYSSEDVAARSRLRLPEGYTSTAVKKQPNEIDYEVMVPADAVHGDWANLALEADGMALGRARLQIFRPASVRLFDALPLHLGSQTELAPDPPIAVIEPHGGSNIEISIRNNWPQIQTFHLEAKGDGLDFFPPKTEVSIGATAERRVSLRVFAKDGAASGLRDFHLRVTGGADLDLPMRVLLLPRGRTVAWSADLDGDGSPEWVLESHKARAVFSARDGGRWMEWNWKDGNVNFLPEQGAFAEPGAVEVRAEGGALEFAGKGWRRTARLAETVLTIEQSTPLPPDGLRGEKRGNVTFSIARPAPGKATYSFE